MNAKMLNTLIIYLKINK